MRTLGDILGRHPLTIVKLGAGGDDYGFIPEAIRQHTVLVCLDAGTTPVGEEHCKAEFAKKVLITQAVAESSGPCTFIERAWWGVSSLLEAKPEVVEKYGHQRLFEERSRTVRQSVTVGDILRANQLQTFDVLMTDLEGLDLSVIKSCGDLVESATIIQCELRFEPFYEGEPYFHEAATYLAEKGFHLIGIKPAYWKPVSRNRHLYTDGVPTWADCLFFRNPDSAALTAPDANGDVVSLSKSIILLSLFGKKSLAAHLYEKHAGAFDETLRTQLAAFIRPDHLPYARTRNFLREIRSYAGNVKRYLGFVARTGRWRQDRQLPFEYTYVAKGKHNL